MTIDELTAKLQEAKAASPLGGNTVVVLCLPDFDMHEVTRAQLILDPAGAMVEIESAVLSGEVDNYLSSSHGTGEV